MTDGEAIPTNHDVAVFPLTHVDNDFVENHPKFAKRNDVTSYLRILGDIRVGLYTTDQSVIKEAFDYTVEYGLALVKGDYDNAGVFTPGNDSMPDPRETSDEDDKWLFKNRAILSFGYDQSRLFSVGGTFPGTEVSSLTNDGTNPVIDYNVTANPFEAFLQVGFQPTRPRMMCTDQQLPNGSKVDIKTRRKAQYAEKLYLIAVFDTDATDVETTLVSIDWSLRVLVNG